MQKNRSRIWKILFKNEPRKLNYQCESAELAWREKKTNMHQEVTQELIEDIKHMLKEVTVYIKTMTVNLTNNGSRGGRKEMVG